MENTHAGNNRQRDEYTVRSALPRRPAYAGGSLAGLAAR